MLLHEAAWDWHDKYVEYLIGVSTVEYHSIQSEKLRLHSSRNLCEQVSRCMYVNFTRSS